MHKKAVWLFVHVSWNADGDLVPWQLLCLLERSSSIYVVHISRENQFKNAIFLAIFSSACHIFLSFQWQMKQRHCNKSYLYSEIPGCQYVITKCAYITCLVTVIRAFCMGGVQYLILWKTVLVIFEFKWLKPGSTFVLLLNFYQAL